nr:hypothetical protein [Niveispirillum lacus]
MSQTVGQAHALDRQLQHLAFMITGNMHHVTAHQQIGGLGREKRTGELVAQVNHLIDPATVDIGQHGGEGAEIAMNVGDDGDTHTGSLR